MTDRRRRLPFGDAPLERAHEPRRGGHDDRVAVVRPRQRGRVRVQRDAVDQRPSVHARVARVVARIARRVQMDGAECADREETRAFRAGRPRADDPPRSGRRRRAIFRRPRSYHDGGVGECTGGAHLGYDDDVPGWVGDVYRSAGRAGQQRHRAGSAAGDALPRLQRHPAARRHHGGRARSSQWHFRHRQTNNKQRRTT